MKMLWICYTTVIAFALCLVGCGVNVDSSFVQLKESKERCFKRSMSVEIYSIIIEGHKYIIFDGTYKGCIIHSESCPCKKRAAE